MKYKFVSMNKEYASDIIDNWKYDGDYCIYDYKYEKEDLLDESGWGFNRFASTNHDNELIGELTVSFFVKLRMMLKMMDM